MRQQRMLVMAVTAWLLAAAPALAQTPEDALKVVPEKAAAFVIVKDLGDLSAKIETLARRLGTALPFSPLEKIKGEMGVGKGLNAKGSLLFAIVVEDGQHKRQIPLLYVPVTDYEAFLQGLNARADGDITTVQLAKGLKEMIVGRQGSFAVFTEPTEKNALQEALRAVPGTIHASLATRLGHNDVTGVLTSRGIKLAAAEARAALAVAKAAPASPETQFMQGWLEGLDGFLKSVESNVSGVLLGTHLDKSGNLELNATALFASGSGFAQAGGKANSLQGQSLAGLPDVPFLVAFNGSMSGDLMKEMMNVGLKLMTAMAKDAPVEKLQKFEQSAGRIFKDLQGMSMVMGAGTAKESLFQSSYVVVKVADSQAYLRNYEEYVEAYNGLMKDIKLPEGFPNQSMKSTKTMVDGLPALEMTVDLGATVNQMELVKKLMELYFGPGGKMVVTTVAVDKKTLLMRYRPAGELKEFIKTYKEGSGGLANNKDVAQTTELLPKGSQWTFFISPRSSVATVHRIMEAMMPPQPGALRLPEFPQTPPIGVGVKLSATGLEKRLVIPAAVLDSVGTFLRQVQSPTSAE